MSVLTGRYSGSSESIFDYDIKRFDINDPLDYLQLVELGELSDAYWNHILPTKLNTFVASSPFFRLFLMAQVKSNDKGFLSTDITVQTMIENRGVIHHLFPKKYLQNNGCKVTLEAIDKPDQKYESFADPLRAGYEHEQYVTGLIHNVYDAANQVKDFRTMQFLDWFVKEQAEEEDTADDMIKKYELFGSDSKGLYMLDNELSSRAYTAPSLTL
mgnify:CR=1 FL=1